MPVTPFHLGPALVVKALLRERMSLGVFTLVQVVIDVESVSNILLGRWPVHAGLHTLGGALAVASVCALGGRPLVSWGNRWLSRRLEGRADIPGWIRGELAPVSWVGAVVGAVFGALSHLVLDGMMHDDMLPFAPLLVTNPILVEGSFLPIHGACAAVGVVGVVVWGRRARSAR